MAAKICSKCGEEKALALFSKSKAGVLGRRPDCKKCFAAIGKLRTNTKEGRAKLKIESAAYYKANKKKHNALCKRWREENKERHAENSKAWRAANRIRANAVAGEWRAANAGKVKTAKGRWRAKPSSAPIEAASAAKRRAMLLHATPSWADDKAIKSKYVMASFLTMATFGKGYHVDHIVPLQGKNVCGLHVEGNLQLMRAEDNLSKGNRHGN